MSSINFLPDDDKGREKLEKKIRTIEYTQPEEDVKSQKKTLHGGVLSIFKRSSNDFPKAPKVPVIPPKPSAAQAAKEPIVKSHSDVKKIEAKTVIAYQKPETQKNAEKKKEKKKPFAWLSRMFSRSAKAPVAHSTQLPPLPPKPYEASSVQKKDAEKATKQNTVLQGGREDAGGAYTKESPDTVSAPSTGSPLPPPPPRFNPFDIPAPKPQGTVQTAHVTPPPVPSAPAGTVTPQEPVMTEAEIDARPRTMGMSFDVNLVPDELVQRKRTMSRLTLLGVIVLVSGFACVVVYGILAFYKTNVSSNVVSVQEETARVQQQIDALTPIQRDALVLQKRTEEIQKLLDAQIHWTKLFTALETYTMKNVVLAKISSDSAGQITIQGQAPDAATAFEQIEVFRNADFVSSLSVQTSPTIPVEPLSSNETDTNSVFISPSESAPGTTEVPTSSFTVQIQLVTDYLVSTGN